MGRAKVAVGILLASTAVGVILLANQPDEVERLMRSSGSVTTTPQWTPDPSSVETSLTQAPQRYAESRVFQGLWERGWRESNQSSDPGQLVTWVRPPGTDSLPFVAFVQSPDRLYVDYIRRPTLGEKSLHAVKSFLHIPD